MAETSFLTAAELEHRTGISARWLRAEARAGRLPKIEPRRGQLLFPAEAAIKALEDRALSSVKGTADAH